MDKKKLLRTAKTIVTNRYFIALAVFMLWIVVIDDRNLLNKSELTQKNHDLEMQQREYERKIHETRAETKKLQQPEYVETIAREQYIMKKDNEDIYMVSKPDNK